MAKREASTQLTKDGGLSEDDGFSVGAQVGGGQRATAVHLAGRRFAKPRGGRRPGTPGQARYPNAPNVAFTQTQPSLFSSNNSNTDNGTQQQQQQDGFNMSNGAQSNQHSQSFPPFNPGSDTGLNTQFAAPSGGFSFSAGQTGSVNNPFANVPPPNTGGFTGNIFNLPEQKKMTSFQKFQELAQPPLFAAHSPFHNDNQNSSTSTHSQPSDNPFDVAAIQQQHSSSQQIPGLFPQQQAPGNMFAPQQPAATTKDLFAPSRESQSQSQTPSTPFGQGNSVFQQPQSAHPTNNLFAHLGLTQPFTNADQASMSSAPEDHSMMSTSPDTSPQTTPFTAQNGSDAQPQASPTKNTTAPGAGLSFFGNIPTPTTQPSVQPSRGSSKDVSTPGAGASLFDRISKPTAEANATPSPNISEHATSPRGGSSLFEGITKPTTEVNTQPSSTPSSSNLFKIAQGSNSSNNTSTSSGDAQPAKKRLFGHSLASQAAQPLTKPNSSMFSPVQIPDFSQPASSSSQSTSHISSSSSGGQVASTNGQPPTSKKRKFGGPPDPFNDCTEDERIQLVTGWRLRLHDAGMQKHLRTDPPENAKAMLMKFYRMRAEEIRAAKGGPLPGPAPGSKRKATEEQHASEAQGKKPRIASSQNYLGTLSNGTGSTSSQTSSIFKNILQGSKNQVSMVNGTSDTTSASASSKTIQYPSLPSSSSNSAKSSLFQPKLSSTSSISPPSGTVAGGRSQGLAFPGTPYQPPSDSLFVSKNTDHGTSATTPKLPSNGFGMTTPLGSSDPIRFKPTSSSQPPSDATKPSAFKVPAFGVSASSIHGNPNTSLTTPQSSYESSNVATKIAPMFRPVNVGATKASEMGGPNSFSVIPASSSEASKNTSKPSTFKVPTFGAGAAPNFLAQFGKAAEKTAEEAKQKRKAEDYDSDEEDEATWERKYEEEQRAKKQKLEEISKNKTAKQIDGKWQFVATGGDKPAIVNTPKETPAKSSLSIFDQPRLPLTNGHNMFGHLSGEESGAEGSKTGDADDEDDGQDEGHDDDGEDEAENGNGKEVPKNRNDAEEQKASGNPFAARSSRPNSPQRNAASSSLFDRISKDGTRNADREGSNPNAKAASFGSGHTSEGPGSSGYPVSKSSTKPAGGGSDSTTNKPSSTSSTNIFGMPSTSSSPAPTKLGESPTGDHTWKADSPIKFGSQSMSPVVNVTAPSPSNSPFKGLFGASKTNATPESPLKSTSSLFGTSPIPAPTTGFGFGFTPANAVKPADIVNPVEPAAELSVPTSTTASVAKPAVNLFAMSSNTNIRAKAAAGLFALPPNHASPAKPTTLFSAFSSNNAFSANPTLQSLAPPSNTASGATSRATSPGATTAESATESTAGNDEDALPKDDQVDLMLARPGEENEDVLFEVKAKAMIYDAASQGDSKWIVKGVGPLRVMKDRATGSTRLLLRAEPSGRIIVNAGLLNNMTYESTSAKAIRVPVPNAKGKIDVYTFKVGKDDDAKELAGILSANRPS